MVLHGHIPRMKTSVSLAKLKGFLNWHHKCYASVLSSLVPQPSKEKEPIKSMPVSYRYLDMYRKRSKILRNADSLFHVKFINVGNRRKAKRIFNLPIMELERVVLNAEPIELIELLGDIASLQGKEAHRLNETDTLSHIRRGWKHLELSLIPILDSFSAKDLLFINDIFYFKQILAWKLNTATLSIYADNENLINDISINEAFHLMFLIVQVKTAPPQLLEDLENVLKKHIDLFSPTDVSFACMVFFNAKWKIKSALILKKMSDIILLSDMKSKFYYSDVNNVMKCFRLSQFQQPLFFSKLSRELCQIYNKQQSSHKSIDNRGNIGAISAISHSYSSARIPNEELFDLFDKELCYAIKHKAFRLKDVVRFLEASGNLQHHNRHKEIVKALECYLSLERAPEWFVMPHMVLEALMAMCHFMIPPFNLLKRLLQPSIVKQIMKHRESTYQLQFMKHLILMDSTDSFDLHHIPEWPVDIMKKHLEYNIHCNQGLGPLLFCMQDVLGGKEYVQPRHVLPVRSTPVLEIRYDKHKQPIAFNESGETYDVDQYMNRDLLPLDSSGSAFWKEEPDNFYPTVMLNDDHNQKEINRCLLAIVRDSHYLHGSSTITGQKAREFKLWNKLGYNVLGISPKQLDRFYNMSAKEQKSYMISQFLLPLGLKYF